MAINQFTQPRKAWIIPEPEGYVVVFKHDPTIPDAIPVEFTAQQAVFVRRFQKMQEKYDALCKGLIKP